MDEEKKNNTDEDLEEKDSEKESEDSREEVEEVEDEKQGRAENEEETQTEETEKESEEDGEDDLEDEENEQPEEEQEKDLDSEKEGADMDIKPTSKAFAPESNPNYSYSFQQAPKKSSKKWIWLLLILVLLGAAGYFLFQNRSAIEQTIAPTPAPTAEPTPSATPEPALNKSEISLEVLNGSGVSGLAKKVADQLKEMGYQVTKTGNADKDDYEQSQIFISSDLEDKVELLIADLKDVVRIASVAGELKDSTASARIILGKD